MTKYVLTYSGGNGDMPTEQAEIDQVMAAWGAWFGQLGDAVVDGGNPFGPAKTISQGAEPADGGVGALTGYSVIQADDFDGALAAARGCPVLSNGGSVSVYEAIDM